VENYYAITRSAGMGRARNDLLEAEEPQENRIGMDLRPPDAWANLIFSAELEEEQTGSRLPAAAVLGLAHNRCA